MTLLAALLLSAGCHGLPMPVQRTVVYNPFPQLAKVAVAPFFNLTTEPPGVVDGRQFGLAYHNQLQRMPGFEVVPIGVVEEAIRAHGLSLAHGGDAQRLAQILEVDAVAVGAVTDFSPYYPPRCALAVEWYAADSSYAPIPPGFGLPWDTAEAEDIPPEIAFDAELAARRAELRQTLPGAVAPVVRHVAAYHSHDAKVTVALDEYVAAQDDFRFGGPGAYLQRSDDFIRFCCYRHIHEMLAARGGAETQVVWPWSGGR